MTVQMMDSFRLLLPDTHWKDEAAIAAALAPLPIGIATRVKEGQTAPTGGLFQCGGISLPILPKDDLRPRQVRIGTGKDAKFGTMVMLDGLLAQAHSFQAGIEAELRRDREWLFRSYEAELWDQTAHHLGNHFLKMELDPAYQAQADTHWGLTPDEIGVSRKVERRLIQLMQKKHGLTEADFRQRYVPVKEGLQGPPQPVPTLDGMRVLFQRYPPCGDKPARWVTLRVLPDVRSTKIYVNGWAFQVIHGGDTDGDLAYFWLPGWLKYDEVAQVFGKAPRLKKVASQYESPKLSDALTLYSPVTRDEKQVALRNQILGACVKDLTGLLTHVYRLFERAACEQHHYEGKRGTLEETYAQIGVIFYFLTEVVMDARKPGGAGPMAVLDLANSLGRMLEGDRWDDDLTRGFAHFLQEDKLPMLAELQRLYEQGGHLKAAFRRAGSALICAGEGGRRLWVQTVVEDLLKQGHRRDEIGDLLIQDLTHTAHVRLSAVPERQPRQPESWVRAHVPVPMTGLQDAVLKLTCTTTLHGTRQVFHEVKQVLKQGEKSPKHPKLVVRGTAFWMFQKNPNPPAYKGLITLQLPFVHMETEAGHCRLQMPGGQVHFYRPTVRICEDGRVRVFDIWNELHFHLARKLAEFFPAPGKKSGKIWSSEAKLQQHLNQAIRDWVESLDQSDTHLYAVQHDEGPCDWFGKREIAIGIGDYKDKRLKWRDLETLLDWLVANGYDVSATSKSRPGSIAAIGNEDLDAAYGRELNPTFQWDNWIRRPELRGIRKSLKLKDPSEEVGVPAIFRDRVRWGWWAILDCNYNRFPSPDGETDECFDTLLVQDEFVDGFAAAEQVFEVEEQYLDEFLVHKRQLGVQEEEIHVSDFYTHVGTHEGQSVSLVQKRVTITNPESCEGKIKSLWSAPKGVMTRLPRGVRPYFLHPRTGEKVYVNLLPAQTAWKKKCVSWLVNSQRRKAGLDLTVRPGQRLEDYILETQVALEDQGWDVEGQEMVYIDHLVPGQEELGATRLPVGRCFVGDVPFYRGTETELDSARFMDGTRGMSLETHAMILARDAEHPLAHPVDPDRDRRLDLLLHALNATRHFHGEWLKQNPDAKRGPRKGAVAASGPIAYDERGIPELTDADCPV